MDEQPRPKNRLAKPLAAAGVLLMLLTIYVGGYFVSATNLEDGIRERRFRFGWQCTIYDPLAWCEAKLTGNTVYLADPEGAQAIHLPD